MTDGTTPATTRTAADGRHHTVVLGAGYAGLITALRLAPHHRVTLVEPNDAFTERVRLHELAAGRPGVSHPLAGFLRGTGIEHIRARATAIDPAARQVHTDDGRTLGYHRLVYGLGSRTATDGGALGTGDRAHTAETAAALRKRLQDGPGTVAVVGGGLTGIELAAELAESYPGRRVRLLTADEIGHGLSAKGRAHVHRTLRGLGVEVAEGRRFASADEVDADTVVWAAAMTANTELAAAAGLALDEGGRIRVDQALRSISHPEVYAVGDAAAAASPGVGPLRMACATAWPTGTHAATSILAELRGREPGPMRFRYQVQCVSLGRRDGLIQFVRPDDTPRDRVLTGRPAAYVKEQIVRTTIRVLRLAHRHPGVLPYLPTAS
ncbi:pyridine nucleotide-disulfide oxidoreductase [Streptomyces albus subsp. albus]|nr:pyridine nucleotide-disulfide oxidoreductase [Streptomyces albus subsp. albus]